jgi:hypothetical protein
VTNYPLLAGFRETVIGNGFVAIIAGNGRLLAENEAPASWWVRGVNPGAIAAGGTTLLEGHAALMQDFKAYVLDVAQTTADFSAFEREIRRFFEATNEPTKIEWDAAVSRVRDGSLVLPSLQKQTAETPLVLDVALVKKFVPQQNVADEAQPLMAA